MLVRLGTSEEKRIRAGPVLATPLFVNTGTLLVGMTMRITAVLFTLLFTKEAGVVAVQLGTVHTTGARWFHVINDPIVASANVLVTKHLPVPAPPLGCLVGGKVLELAAVILGHVTEVLLIEESLVEDITLIEHVHTDIVVVVVVVVVGCGTVEDHCEEEKNERQREKLHGLFCCSIRLFVRFDCVCSNCGN